jgi:hypothetical protein
MPGDPPFSQACENNKEPILALLREHLADSRCVLEIGSGTGQHAVHFAAALPQLRWLTSDRPQNHPAILAWLAHRPAPNLQPPITLDTRMQPWPETAADAVFSANTAHIMHLDAVRAMILGVAALLPVGGPFLLYGPFRYGDRHTSASNAGFDASLRAMDPGMGIRDALALQSLAAEHGLVLVADHAMPANNRTLVWQRA